MSRGSHVSTWVTTFLCQSFYNKYICIIKGELGRWNNLPNCKAISEENGIGQYPVWMIQKPREFPGGECPRTPLEPSAFGARSANRSLFILDPCLRGYCWFRSILYWSLKLSVPSIHCNGWQETLLCLNIILNNKTGPLVLDFLASMWQRVFKKIQQIVIWHSFSSWCGQINQFTNSPK